MFSMATILNVKVVLTVKHEHYIHPIIILEVAHLFHINYGYNFVIVVKNDLYRN